MFRQEQEAMDFLKEQLNKRDIFVPTAIEREIATINEMIPPSSRESYGDSAILRAANYYEVYLGNLKLDNLQGRETNLIKHSGSNSSHKILGNDFQVLEFELDPNEEIYTVPGAMLYADGEVEMATKMGGLFKGLKRVVSGEQLFVTSFKNKGSNKSKIAVASGFPGSVLQVDLTGGKSFICQRGGFLAGVNKTELSIAFTGIGAGLFGGAGFVLQKITSDSMVFVFAGGSVIERNLKQGETLQVDTGALVGFEPSVQYSIQRVKGVSNMLFGNEGIFNAKLVGPGKVYIQSLPLQTFANNMGALMGFQSNQKNSSNGEIDAVDVISTAAKLFT